MLIFESNPAVVGGAVARLAGIPRQATSRLEAGSLRSRGETAFNRSAPRLLGTI